MDEELEEEIRPDEADNSDELDFDFEDSSNAEETATDESGVDKPDKTDEGENKVDFTPLLDELSKRVKFKDEEIKIDNIEDVISNYQKGKNYEPLQDKLNKLVESPQIKLINKLAEESGMTPEQYVELVIQQQEETEKQAEQQEYNELIEKGISEELAKKIIENNRIAKEFQKEKLKVEQEKKNKEKEVKRNEEYEEFLKTYPDVKVEEIPKEVFINASNSNLKAAYTEYLLKETQKQVEALNTKKSSPVTSVTKDR